MTALADPPPELDTYGARPDVPPGGAPAAPAPAADDPAGQGWRQDKQGRWFTPAKGRSGVVYRRGNETPDEARERDKKGPKDKPPRRPPSVAKPPAPTQVDEKQLEHVLTEALRMPGMMCAAAGDQWGADHFAKHAPTLARNLVAASHTNPWLRAKLESVMHGEEFMFGKIIGMMGVAGALIFYAVPPLIYYVNPPFISREAREMFGVPDRPKREPATAPPPDPAPSADPAAA